MTRRIRVIPPIYFLAAAAAMLALDRLAPIYRLVLVPWKWLGLIPVVVGLLLGISAARLFLRRGTTLRPGQPASRMVTGGPFRYTRNPMYLGLATILVGLPD